MRLGLAGAVAVGGRSGWVTYLARPYKGTRKVVKQQHRGYGETLTVQGYHSIPFPMDVRNQWKTGSEQPRPTEAHNECLK